jgi:hypothetical protein
VTERTRNALLAIALVIALPILFATAGGGQGAGLLVGVALVAVGLVLAVRGR